MGNSKEHVHFQGLKAKALNGLCKPFLLSLSKFKRHIGKNKTKNKTNKQKQYFILFLKI